MKRLLHNVLAIGVLLALASGAYWLLSLPQARAVFASALVGRWVTPSPDCTIAPGRMFTIDYFGTTYYGDTSSLTDIYLLCYGSWEPAELAFLKHSAEILDRDNLVFVDVGANSGLHSLYMSKHVDIVHAFDPYVPVLERFEKSVAASGITNIVMHPVGLGERDAELPFQEPGRDNLGAGSFVLETGENQRSPALKLKIMKGDTYFEKMGISGVGLMKVDIEGYEKLAFRGLKDVLNRDRPVIIFEFTGLPDVPELFQDQDEMRSVFPNSYEFFEVVLSGDPLGYKLRAPDLRYQSSIPPHQKSIAAIPAEISQGFSYVGR